MGGGRAGRGRERMEGGRMSVGYYGTGIAMVEMLHTCVTTAVPSDRGTACDTALG